MRVQVRVHFHFCLAKPGQQQPRGRKFSVAVDILSSTPPPHTHTRTTTTTKNQLLGEAEVGCSLEPRRVRPAGAKLGNSAPKNKNNLKAGGTTIQLLLGLSPQITWALEPKEATLSLQDTDLVSDQSQNTPTVAPTLQLETSKPE